MAGRYTADVELIGFQLYNPANGRFLFEYRPADADLYPGKKRILGGHIEPGETAEEAAYREIWEELSIRPTGMEYICRAIDLHGGRIIGFNLFGLSEWEGELSNPEGKHMVWSPASSDGIDPLDRWSMDMYSKMIGIR